MSYIITANTTGQIGVKPRLVHIFSENNTYSEITTAGYISGNEQLDSSDFILFTYSGGFAIFNPSFSALGVITLVPSSSNVLKPTIANHIATYSNTLGVLTEDAGTAINGGNLQAGLSGTAGYLASFPATASKGSVRWQATANTGNTVTTFTNAAMGQATIITTPDPAGATANDVIAPAALVNNNLVKASGTAGLVADAGARIISNTTAAYGGGGTSNAYAATGLTVASKGTAVIRASTNSVSITKALPGTDTLTITFSADPGAATTVDYNYTTAFQS